MWHKIILTLIYFSVTFSVHAVDKVPASSEQENPQTSQEEALQSSKQIISFETYADNGTDLVLTGTRPKIDIEFLVRKDQLVTKGELFITMIPSPSLVPKESHVKVHLNDKLLGVIELTKDDLGKRTEATLPLNPLFVKDFNQISITFVGQYDSICPTWDSPALWLEINQDSQLTLMLQQIPLTNDLAYLPVPFFDPLDNNYHQLTFAMSDFQNQDQQLAASILSSWFGTLAKWRGTSASVLDNTISNENTVVLITNEKRPSVLADYPKVSAPTIEIRNNPKNQYSKLLIISGRDNQDLIKAVTGLAQAPQLFRGQKVTIKETKPLRPRKPYDAPFWIQTDKPTTLGSLKTYDEQLQTQGIKPLPVFLNFKIPPDLYLNHTRGIALNIIYQYSEPSIPDASKLNISLNNSFVRSYTLHGESVARDIIPGVSYFENSTQTEQALNLPVSVLGNNNQLAFDFNYALKTGEGSLDGKCTKASREFNQAMIDGRSTIDFSNYRHYIAMPNLRVFMFGGFPYSRMADLSETMAFLPENASENQLAFLLNIMGRMGAETGLPVYRLGVTHDWDVLKSKDADMIVIGKLPTDFNSDKHLSLYLTSQQSWLKSPIREQSSANIPINADDAVPANKTTLAAKGVLAAIAQVQSPFHKNRTLVAVLANNNYGFDMLNKLLLNPKQLQKIYGSVSIIRSSGVSSLKVGDVYYVGNLPLLVKTWYILQNYPLSLALFALVGAILASWLLRRLFMAISNRRLNPEKKSGWNE